MNERLPLSNLSLKKLLGTEPDAFNKARIKILYIIMVFTLVKIGIIIASALYAHQPVLFNRAFINLLFYVILIKLLLSKRISIPLTTHLLLINGTIIIWMNIFYSSQSVGTITLQFAFMATVSGFYLLNKSWGLIYSLLSMIPVLGFIFMKNQGILHYTEIPEVLLYPGTLIITTLNFITIILAHHLFLEAFNESIEEKLQLNLQLKDAVKEANKLAQSKSDFLSTMSHELRTPLNMVIGMTELLNDAPHSKEQQENLKVLNFSATSLHSLINDILDFNKLESTKIELESVSLNLYDLLYSICSGLDMQAQEKGLDFVLEMDDEIKKHNVITDPTRITQIIYNLVGNGIKFTTSGTIKLGLDVVKKSDYRMQVKFSVSDTGIGISEAEQLVIFEPFTQASTSTTRSYGGTGLGLSIVKRLLALFESSIKLESGLGKGSVFMFEIDFKTDTTSSTTDGRATDHEGFLTGLRLLAAEDNAMNTFLLKKLCTKWNIEPVVVENGTQAVKAMNSGFFDVVLMDIHMPEMDGYEASREIRKINDPQKSAIPIIALTASVSHNLEVKIKEAGMNDYIRKPFHSNDLFSKLKKYHVE
ncbi:MAG: ATP-binding protein [Bacteroidota bacterium]